MATWTWRYAISVGGLVAKSFIAASTHTRHENMCSRSPSIFTQCSGVKGLSAAQMGQVALLAGSAGQCPRLYSYCLRFAIGIALYYLANTHLVRHLYRVRLVFGMDPKGVFIVLFAVP